jgi:iron(III) transport system ATP-binding protein
MSRPVPQPHPVAEHRANDPDLSIAGLRKVLGSQTVLDGIDLDVSAGQIITVLGPSGSGKTTLLRLICGFERADAGVIRLSGRLLADGRKTHMPPERRGVGYVAQEGALFPHLDVRRNIEFGLSRRQRATTDVEDLLAAVGLPASYANRAPSALSGGEQQRVALARALAPGPHLVLLDEPFSSLDAGLRVETRNAVAKRLRDAGATAILVTHDQDEALSMGDKVAVMHNGRLAQVASPRTLYDRPANLDIARFIGEAVLVPGITAGDTVDCCFGRLQLTTHVPRPGVGDRRDVNVLIRPEQFRLCVDHAADNQTIGSDAFPSTACVEQILFYGHDARIQLRLRDGQPFTATVPGFDLPAIGQTVSFRVAGNVYTYPY